MSEAKTAHAEKNAGILKITINLAVTCLVSGAILAGAYYLTHDTAVKKEAEMKTKSMQALVAGAAAFTDVSGEDGMTAAKAADGKVVAYIVQTEPKGYGGAIKLLVAVTPDGKVYNFKILSSNETPGLGSKAAESPFKDQFPGKTSDQLVVTKDPSKTDEVVAMTGATISSKAVTSGIKEAVDKIDAYVGEGK